VVVDSARSVTTTVPPTGGVVQAQAADGTVLSLAVPGAAVRAATAITIAPLLAFPGIPAGPLVAGISAEPSGLHFDEPATLTITLPAGFQPAAFGLMGFVADRDGRNLQAVPARRTGNVVTVTVPHFSIAGVALTSDWLAPCVAPSSAEMATACQQLRPLYDAEVARLNSQGGPLSPVFQVAVGSILIDWAIDGILPRMRDAQMPGAPDPFLKPSKVLGEWFDWVRSFYEPVFGHTFDRTNEAAGLPIGALIDQIQAEARLTFRAGRDAINVKCLADKANVRSYIESVTNLYALWFLPLPAGFVDETTEYCAGIRVDAFPPPVLTPGQGSAMPVDIRLRFIDGQDLPGGELLSVSIAATSATVTPAGGVLSSPMTGTVTLTPSSTSSLVTITAAATEPILQQLPVVTKTFQAGESLPFTFGDDPDLFGLIRAQQIPNPASERRQHSRTLPSAALDLAWPTPNELVAARLTATRNIVGGAAGFTAALSGTIALSLTPPSSAQRHSGTNLLDHQWVEAVDAPYQTYVVEAHVSDSWSVTLPTAFTVVAGLSPSAELWIDNQPVRDGDRVTLSAGERAVSFNRVVRLTNTNGVPGGESSATPSYTLTFTPVP
jgi:hypothetical protein